MKIIFILITLPLLVYPSFMPDQISVNLLQTVKTSVSGIPGKSKVLLKYKSPNLVNIEVLDDQTLIFGKERFWTIRKGHFGEKAQVDDEERPKHPYLNLVLVLKNGLTENEYYKVQKNGPRNYFLDFTSQGTNKFGIISIVLNFQKTNKLIFTKLESLKTTFSSKKILDYSFISYNNEKLNDSDFEYKAEVKNKVRNL